MYKTCTSQIYKRRAQTLQHNFLAVIKQTCDAMNRSISSWQPYEPRLDGWSLNWDGLILTSTAMPVCLSLSTIQLAASTTPPYCSGSSSFATIPGSGKSGASRIASNVGHDIGSGSGCFDGFGSPFFGACLLFFSGPSLEGKGRSMSFYSGKRTLRAEMATTRTNRMRLDNHLCKCHATRYPIGYGSGHKWYRNRFGSQA